MTAPALIAAVRRLGVSLERSHDGRLLVRPASRVPPGLMAELRAHKSAVLALLTTPPLGADPGLVAAFGQQIDTWEREGCRGIPVLVLPSSPAPRCGACISCGIAIDDGWRCAACLAAV